MAKPRRKPFFVRFEDSVSMRLQGLAKHYGYSVPALIRACVDRALDDVEKRVKDLAVLK